LTGVTVVSDVPDLRNVIGVGDGGLGSPNARFHQSEEKSVVPAATPASIKEANTGGLVNEIKNAEGVAKSTITAYA